MKIILFFLTNNLEKFRATQKSQLWNPRLAVIKSVVFSERERWAQCILSWVRTWLELVQAVWISCQPVCNITWIRNLETFTSICILLKTSIEFFILGNYLVRYFLHIIPQCIEQTVDSLLVIVLVSLSYHVTADIHFRHPAGKWLTLSYL